MIFAVLLGLYLPWLFALIVLAAAVAYWGQARYRRWYAAHNAENARYDQQLRYLTRSAYAPENGKDARLYPVASWHHAHLQRLERAKMSWQRQSSLREFGAAVLGDTAGLLRDAGVYVYLVVGVVKASLSLARFTLLFGITNQFVTLTTQLLDAWHTVQKASVDLQELRAFLSLPGADTATVPADVIAALAKRPVTIQFRDVIYRYPGAKTASLSHISFTLHAGEHLALVGLNGAGKSTLAKLMMGLLTPSSGSITYNGVAAANLPPAARFALFAPVFQESEVLALTIAENVAMSQSPDTKRVAAALAAAKLTKLVAAQANGAATPMTHAITDAGVSLSGGQTQRLMLARAVYKDAPVLILDEPTAALDALAESALYQEYTALSAGKSAVFISHRLASTRFCDRILVLAQGELVAAGTHAELLAQGGLYADLYRTQSQYYQQEAQDERK